jgi:dihydrofolate synthase/folylpolyglutamate synthase
MKRVTGIGSYDDALAAILDRANYDRGFISNPFAGDEAARRGLSRTRAMLDRLGHPKRAYPIVHVAGSKGKGSTCVFVDGILRAAGRTSGRYLSPHLHSWRERFVVDDRQLPEGAFVELTRDAVAAAEAVETAQPELGAVTAFELTTAMALLWFQRAGCDVAVVEVGLGGTLDATNVIDPAVTVIAPLDFEHTAILGATMAEIAANKAGIIKPRRPVVTASQPADGLAVIGARAAAHEAPLLVAGRDFTTTGTDCAFVAAGPWGEIGDLRSGLIGKHQTENATLAIAAVHALGWDDIGVEAIRAGVAGASLPGRFEEVTLAGGQVVIIDGAHSGRSADALATATRDRCPDTAPVIVAGLLRDKDAASVLAPLADRAERWIVTSPASPRALPAGELGAALAALGATFTEASSVAAAIDAAVRSGHPLIVVTGSLTTAAEARAALGLA